MSGPVGDDADGDRVWIRRAVAEDIPAMAAIYAPYVEDTVISFEEEPRSLAQWLEKLDHLDGLGLPVLVALDGQDRVLGFAYAAPWSERAAYRQTVEDSVYLDAAARGRGIGPRLMRALIDACATAGIRAVIAVIADQEAEASVRMHARLGFAEVGRLPAVGVKFGRRIGVVLMQLSLAQDDAQGPPSARDVRA